MTKEIRNTLHLNADKVEGCNLMECEGKGGREEAWNLVLLQIR